VVLTPFAIGRFSVTTAEFADFLNDAKLDLPTAARLLQVKAAPGITVPAAGHPVTVNPEIADLPVTGITWRGAIAYAQWLSDRTGQVYVIPSEAQWEYAARAGAGTIWPWGDAFDPERVNCDKPDGAILPERQLAPNRFALAGIPGNVWEWTTDCLDLEFYLHSPTVDPVFLDAACRAPMIRGGSFRDPRVQCSPSYRVNYFAQGFPNGIGFRVVRRMKGPAGETGTEK
jgi:formylglycine-generating enzyme required for sulfatase activity